MLSNEEELANLLNCNISEVQYGNQCRQKQRNDQLSPTHQTDYHNKAKET